MPSSSYSKTSLVGVCFVLSGMAGLIYETVWIRHLSLILGHTTVAISLVVATYMMGLCLGSFLYARIFSWTKGGSFLKTYIYMELGVAVFGVVSYGIIQNSSQIIVEIGVLSRSPWRELTWLIFCSAPLLVPTLLMGATFPLLVAWFSEQIHTDKPSKIVSQLYGLNLLGALLGLFLCGFWFIPVLGIKNCYLLAGSLNGMAALLGIFVKDAKPNKATKIGDSEFPHLNQVVSPFGFFLILTGFASMVSQLAWTRLFSLVIGSSTYSFSLILFMFLLGLALGNFFYHWLLRFFDPEWSNLWPMIAILGVGIISSLPMFNKLPYYSSQLFRYADSFKQLLTIHFFLTGIILFLPTLLMGMIFPWALAAVQSSREKLSNHVAVGYAATTIGAILGTMLTGLVFIPRWGAETSLIITAWVYLFAALLVIGKLTLTSPAKKWRMAVSLILIVSMVTGLRPPLDSAILSSGSFIYAPEYMREKSYGDFIRNVHQNRILHHKDGLTSTVTVLETNWGGRFLRVNGKTDASSIDDMGTQLLLAYLPYLLHPIQPQKALVIGLGSGMTLGGLGTIRSINNLDCVEIEPNVKESLHFFEQFNRAIEKDPRVQFFTMDARHYLKASPTTYDLIVSEPSNPWMAGVSNLYTREAFLLSQKKLNKNGVFCQWFHSYSMGLDDFKMVLATFAEVFPHVILFSTGDKDYFLLGSNDAWDINYELWGEKFKENTNMREDLTYLGLGHPFTLLASTFLIEDDAFRRFSSSAQIHHDDRPVLEFSAPKYLHRGEEHLIFMELTAQKKQSLPSNVTHLSPDQEGWSYLHNLAGEAFLRSHQIAAAEKSIQEAFSKSQSDPRTWVNKGRLHNLKNEHLQAEKCFKKAMALKNSYALAHFHLGMLYLDQGLEPLGLTELETGLRFAPGDPMGSYRIALIYIKDRREEEARQILKAALQNPIPNVELAKRLIMLLESIGEKKS